MSNKEEISTVERIKIEEAKRLYPNNWLIIVNCNSEDDTGEIYKILKCKKRAREREWKKTLKLDLGMVQLVKLDKITIVDISSKKTKRLSREEAKKLYPDSWILFIHYDINDEKGEIYKTSKNYEKIIKESKKLIESNLDIGNIGLFSTKKQPENVWVGIF